MGFKRHLLARSNFPEYIVGNGGEVKVLVSNPRRKARGAWGQLGAGRGFLHAGAWGPAALTHRALLGASTPRPAPQRTHLKRGCRATRRRAGGAIATASLPGAFCCFTGWGQEHRLSKEPNPSAFALADSPLHYQCLQAPGSLSHTSLGYFKMKSEKRKNLKNAAKH